MDKPPALACILFVLAAGTLAACDGSRAMQQVALPASGFDARKMALRQTSQSGAFTMLHSFGASANDGGNPQAPLVYFRGTLYGTTLVGGSGCYSSGGCGTVFTIRASGAEALLHSFGGGKDGAYPYAGLLKVNGVLYGTTGGGASTDGTVFSIDAAGAEKVLYHFKSGRDASDPHAAVIDVHQTFYGTTVFGGTKGRGAVYALTASGRERVLYSFSGTKDGEDGKYPTASLLNVDGVFYGTTYKGGTRDRGTVFKVTPDGHETVLHSFVGGSQDGAYPRGGLTELNGSLYGTASAGGVGMCKGCGNYEHYGVVFKITTSGKETVLYKFKGYPNDGANPQGNLLDVNGVFYGVTQTGGAGCGVDHGCGTIFSVTPAGTETMLYSLVERRDGALPLAGLVEVGGTLYGTTSQGGPYNGGTVFAFTP